MEAFYRTYNKKCEIQWLLKIKAVMSGNLLSVVIQESHRLTISTQVICNVTMWQIP